MLILCCSPLFFVTSSVWYVAKYFFCGWTPDVTGVWNDWKSPYILYEHSKPIASVE